MPLEVIVGDSDEGDTPDRTIRGEPNVINGFRFSLIETFICSDGSVWATSELAQAWAQDHCEDEVVNRNHGFMIVGESSRVWTYHNNPQGGFWELGCEYEPRESEERIRRRALAKLDADEIRALGISPNSPRPGMVSEAPLEVQEEEAPGEPSPTMWEHLDEE